MKVRCLAPKDPVPNSSYFFIKEIEAERPVKMQMRLAAADCAVVFLNGEAVFYGPTRTARGYGVINSAQLKLKAGANTLAVLLTVYGIECYSNVKQPPYIYIRTGERGEITERDFACCKFDEKHIKTQRYSYQRGSFAEYYSLSEDFAALINKKLKTGERAQTEETVSPQLINEPFALILPESAVEGRLVSGGTFVTDTNAEIWNDRCVSGVGDKMDGYTREEQPECLSDTVSRFAYAKGETKGELCGGEYAVYDLSVNTAGFISFEAEVSEGAEIYMTFEEKADGNLEVNPFRLRCCNIAKFALAPGLYRLQTLEPYGLKLISFAVAKGKVNIKKAYVKPLANVGAARFSARTEDPVIDEIFKAAANTLAQNAYDIITDCPTRERAFWLNDAYFTRRAADMFLGSQTLADFSIKNLIVGEWENLPEGMPPMCYPADHKDGNYIPNNALWLALLLCGMSGRLRGALKQKAGEKTRKIFGYFARHENELGLLENLGGWIFSGWSSVSSPQFTKGVNYPVNMLYAKALKCAAAAFKIEGAEQKAESVIRTVRETAFDGQYFCDNSVREGGQLKRTRNISETCQYFAFFSGVATPSSHPNLYKDLIENFGPKRRAGHMPEIDRSDIITGLLLRLDILLDGGLFDMAVDEVKEIFGKMAPLGTLWENAQPLRSFNHGISSYCAVALARAMCGYAGVKNGKAAFIAQHSHNYNCSFNFPSGDRSLLVTVKNGVRKITKTRER